MARPISNEERRLLIETFQSTQDAALSCKKVGVSNSTLRRYWKRYVVGGWASVLEDPASVSRKDDELGSLEFRDLEFVQLYSIDLYHLVSERERSTLFELRGTPGWLQAVSEKTAATPSLAGAVGLPRFDAAAYRAADRAEKLTIADSYLADRAPLVWSPEQSANIGQLSVRLTQIRLHEAGVLTCRIVCTEVDIDDATDRLWRVDDLVSELRRNRSELLNYFSEVVRLFARQWNALDIAPTLDIPPDESLWRRLAPYEILLFDYECSDGRVRSIKSLRDSENSHYLRQLVGLTRMARRIAWPTYSHAFATAFVSQDLGNRDNELWLVYEERLLRHFPQRRDSVAQLWLTDAFLAIEILLALRTALELVIFWSHRQLVAVRNDVSAMGSVAGDQLVSLVERIRKSVAEIYYLLSTVSDPFEIERGIAHGFFRKLVNAFVVAKRIDRLADDARRSLEEIHQTNQMLQNAVYSELNLELQRLRARQVALDLQQRSAADDEAHNFNRTGITIGVAAAIIGLAELVGDDAARAFIMWIMPISGLVPMDPQPLAAVFWTRVLLITSGGGLLWAAGVSVVRRAGSNRRTRNGEESVRGA